MILLWALSVSGCQSTSSNQGAATNQISSKLTYEDLTPEIRQLSESTTKCALAMLVLDNKNYRSIESVYFNNGDTYGELMSVLDESSKKKLLDNVAVRVEKYAALHYKGEIFPVMLEYVFSQECRSLYFSDGFKEKYSDLIKSLDGLKL